MGDEGYRPEIVALKSGERVTVRRIEPGDAPRLQAMAARLSPATIFARFMSPARELSAADARRLARVDGLRRMALVAAMGSGDDEEIVAVARYVRGRSQSAGEAEVAVVVQDSLHRLGLGTLLLERLVAYARAHDVRTLTATVLPENDAIKELISKTGLPAEYRHVGPGEAQVVISLVPGTPGANQA